MSGSPSGEVARGNVQTLSQRNGRHVSSRASAAVPYRTRLTGRLICLNEGFGATTPDPSPFERPLTDAALRAIAEMLATFPWLDQSPPGCTRGDSRRRRVAFQ